MSALKNDWHTMSYPFQMEGEGLRHFYLNWDGKGIRDKRDLAFQFVPSIKLLLLTVKNLVLKPA
jgi:hypothetical protein